MKYIRPALIVDEDRKYGRQIHQAANGDVGEAPVLYFSSFEAAFEKLNDPRQEFSAIFITPMARKRAALRLIKATHLNRVGTPLYVLYKKKAPFSEGQLRGLGVENAMEKPSFEDIQEMVQPIITEEDFRLAFESNPMLTGGIDQGFTANDTEFTPVVAENFLSGKKTLFDTFVRLASGKFIKLIHKGDDFDPERLLTYISKGVHQFYIKKTDQARYVEYCDYLSSALLGRNHESQALKTSRVMNLGDQVIRFLKNAGVDTGKIQHSCDFVNKVQKLIRQKNFQNDPEVDTFLKDLVSYEHGIATTMIAALLTQPFGLNSSRFEDLVGMSAMFHDIGLFRMQAEIHGKKEVEMNAEQKMIYRDHPRAGGLVLRKTRKFDSAVIQAVEQHHERRDGSGFPLASKAGEITRIAEIVGIADEFVDVIIKSNENPNLDPFFEMERKVFSGFSYPVIEAFRTVFHEHFE